jgi:hypothetical protein
LTWEQWTEVLSTPGDLTRLRQRIERWESPQATLLELRLSGLFSPSDEAELVRIDELLAARFVLGRIDKSALMPAPTDDSWLADLPSGVLVETARRLQAMPDSPVAAQALLELYRLAQQVP